jgi:hypothetical protein
MSGPQEEVVTGMAQLIAAGEPFTLMTVTVPGRVTS